LGLFTPIQSWKALFLPIKSSLLRICQSLPSQAAFCVTITFKEASYMKHLLLFFAILLAAPTFIFAQTMLDYSFSTNATGSLESMSSGTTQLLTEGVYHDNDASAVTNIGFNFKFGDTVYTQFSANSNGQMRLGPTAISGSTAFFSSGLSLLVPLSDDNAIRANGKLHCKVVGTAPNRRLVVEWLNVVIPATTSPSNSNFSNFQAWLYETSNRIQFVYGVMYTNSSSSQNRAVFISTSNVSGSVGWLQNITTTITWINSGTSYSWTQFAGNSTMYNLYGFPDGSRRVFTFDPPDPLAVPNPALLVSPANNATGSSIYTTLAWSSGGGLPTSYDLYWNGATTPVNLTGTTWNPGTLAYSTAYTWQIVPRNANGPAINCPDWSFTTRADRTITSLPHTEGFDGTWSGTPPAPDGWTVVNANNDSYKWHQSTLLLPVSNPAVAAGEGNTNDYLISPPIDLSATDARIKWWDKCFSSAYSFTYKVLVSTTTDLVPAFTNLLGTYTCNSGSWVKHILNLDAFTGQTVYVAFWQTASSSTVATFGIDDFTVEVLPTSPIFSLSPAVSEWDFGELLPGGANTKTFTITNMGVGSLELESVTTAGTYFSISSPPADMSLTAEESTNFTVRYAPLEIGMHTSSASVNYNGETAIIGLAGICVPDPVIYYADLPYRQDFDSLNPPALPLGWADLGAYLSLQLLAVQSYSSPNCLALTINSYGTGIAALPPLVANGTDIRVRFRAKRIYYGAAGLDVGWLATPGVASTFVPISSLSIYQTEYAEYSAVFPAAADTVWLALRADCDTNVFAVIDDLVIEEITEPIFSRSPASLWFGEGQHGIPTAWQNVTVTNTGGGTLELTAANLSLGGGDPTQFELDASGLPVSLGCTQSVVIPVRMTPTETGSVSATLIISYGGQTYETALSGSGLQDGIICIGTGTQDLGLPIDTGYGYNYSQSMYMQSELNVENKQIEKIWFNWTGGILADMAKDWVIYMGHASWEEFYYNNYWVPWYDLTEVFNGEVFLYEASYWLEITLDTPFPYNNIQNLVIAVDENTPGYEMGATSDFRCSPSTLNRAIRFRNDSINPWYGEPPVGTTMQGFPNIRILFTDIPTLYPPVLTYPANAASNLPEEGFSFSWEPDPASVPADSYTLYVSDSNVSEADFFDTPYVYANAVPPLDPGDIPYQLGQTWYWTVRATAAGFPNAYQWPPYEFTIEPYPYIYLPHTETVDLEQFPANWTQTFDGTLVYGPWSVVTSNQAGGAPCEFRCDWYWGVSGTGRLISPPIYTGDVEVMQVFFKYAFESLGSEVTPKLQYSHDLVTWQDTEWLGPGVYGSSAGTASVSVPVGSEPTTYLGWAMTGNFLSFNFWWLDDFVFEETVGRPVVSIDAQGILSWEPVSGADHYNIYRSDDPYGEFTLYDSTAAFTWTDPSGLVEKRFYRVTSVLSARGE
jgi:hypothetical protein